tara:strand:- start:824 stop:1618 length:795 start_codon:yes stop_codon:yes gene_type:complete
MADTKIGNLPTDIVTLAAGDRFPVYDASATTTDTYCTPVELQTFFCIAPVFAAGSASAGTWPKLTAGTVMTTAEVGAFELDANCLYFCTDAGNRGVVPVRHFIRSDSTRTLANSGAAQKLWDSPTNGTLTLETGYYRFEGQFLVDTMSGTSGNLLLDILGAGGATTGSWLWHAIGIDSTTPATATTQTGSFAVTSASGASVVTAAGGTAVAVSFWGSFEVTVAGTIIPSVTLVTAVGTAVLNVGSHFEIWRDGSTSVASIGQWS